MVTSSGADADRPYVFSIPASRNAAPFFFLLFLPPFPPPLFPAGLPKPARRAEDDVDDDLVNQIEKYYSIEIKQLKDINELVEILEEMRKGIE